MLRFRTEKRQAKNSGLQEFVRHNYLTI